jgi:hypothetical protein
MVARGDEKLLSQCGMLLIIPRDVKTMAISIQKFVDIPLDFILSYDRRRCSFLKISGLPGGTRELSSLDDR